MKRLPVLDSRELGSIHDFLDELKDGAAYKARLKVLEDQKKEINALIAVVGKVNEIEGLHLKASQLKEGAEKLVEDARADRAEAAEEAKVAKAASDRFVSERNGEANAKFTDREKAVNAAESDLGKREKAVERALDDIASRERQVEHSIEVALSIKTTYDDAVTSLKAAIGEIAGAL